MLAMLMGWPTPTAELVPPADPTPATTTSCALPG